MPPRTPDNKRKRGAFSSGHSGDSSTPRKKQIDIREFFTRRTKPGDASTSTVPKQETDDDLDARDLYSTPARPARHREEVNPDEGDAPPTIIFTRSRGQEEFKCEVEERTAAAAQLAQEFKLEEQQPRRDILVDDHPIALTPEELQVPKPPCTCKAARQHQAVSIGTVQDEPNTNGNRGKKYYRCDHWCTDRFINFFDDWEMVVETKLGRDWRKLPAGEIPEWLPCRGRVKMAGTTDDWRYGRRNHFERNVEEGGKLVVKDLVGCEWKGCECVGGDCALSEE
ncbi:hypothetical protein BJ875DRAFT_485677 [Amylocarpus encephaloides]|uniref:Uncharacterized protein n=1 Tax=Amylocarpus encephaloides TaxID=45428 RepID=A0A9P8C3R2_9HELO|nr:hypothetical protein BJ875DRAFT_485677 [Amylocarpus encephaloides]